MGRARKEIVLICSNTAGAADFLQLPNPVNRCVALCRSYNSDLKVLSGFKTNSPTSPAPVEWLQAHKCKYIHHCGFNDF